MVTEDLTTVSPGRRLGEILKCYRQFVQNTYNLLQFIEVEISEQDWSMIRPGSYSVTRNGMGYSLTNFATADWVPTVFAIGFVPAPTGGKERDTRPTTTHIPPQGLEILYFAVRFLDLSPDEPTLWFGRLRANQEGSGEHKRWEDCQTYFLRHLEADGKVIYEGHGELKPKRISFSQVSVSIEGDYTAVPLVRLLNEQDVREKVILPAVGRPAE